MKKKWGAYIYVPILAFLVAGGGAYIWKVNNVQSENGPEQVYYLDEFFESQERQASEAHVVDEKNVILETAQSYAEESETAGSIVESVAEAVKSAGAQFVLRLEDGHIIVYRKEDMSECYMATGISAEDLPEKTLNEIIEGKEILDEEALYFFLESYSS